MTIEEKLEAAENTIATLTEAAEASEATRNQLAERIETLTAERDQLSTSVTELTENLQSSTSRIEKLEAEAATASERAQRILAESGQPQPAAGLAGDVDDGDVVAGLRACSTDSERAAYFAEHRDALAGHLSAAEFWGLSFLPK